MPKHHSVKTNEYSRDESLRSPNFGSRRVFFVVYFRTPPVALIIASRWSAIDELTGQDLEGSGRSITEVLFHHSLGMSEDNYEKLHSGLLKIRPIFQLGFSETQIWSATLYK